MKYLTFAAAVLLASCVNGQPNTNNTVAALQSTYAAALAAEISYESSGLANPQIVRQIEVYRVQANVALEPLVKAAEAGQPIEAAAITSATTVLNDLANYLVSQNLMKAPAS